MSIKITTESIKDLRDRTGVSVMQCKNALEEAEGDLEKALIILKKQSSDMASKREERSTKEGLVIVKETENKALLFSLRVETDFVAKNNDFVELANKLANIAFEEGVEVMKEKSVEMINEVIHKVGEKIELGKAEIIEGNVLGVYAHSTKNAVVVALESGSKEIAKDVAMHIAAMKPSFINKDQITEDDKKKVVEVFEREVSESDKPEEIKQKMLEGKISTYFKEITLMDQAYIKDPNTTIEKLLETNNAKLKGFVAEFI